MNEQRPPVVVVATNAAGGELAAWRQAVDRLNAMLGPSCTFSLAEHTSPDTALASAAPVIGLSLQDELDTQTDIRGVEAAWAQSCAAMAAGRTVFVSTILRHIPQASQSSMARLRRLNLLAARLSQSSGLLVIDIDRELAHRGALALETDARLQGLRGQEAAARVIANAVLCYGLAGLVDDAVLDAVISDHEGAMGSEIDRLSVPVALIGRQATRVGGRQQTHLVHQPAFDDRGVKGLLRDLRRGRTTPSRVAAALCQKIMARLPARIRSIQTKV